MLLMNCRRFYVQLLILVLVSIGHAKGEEKAASATENYISARNIGFDRVLADYSEELEILLADRKKDADLEGAKAAKAELEWIEAIRKRAKSTEPIPLPDSSERKVGLASLLRARSRMKLRISRGLELLARHHLPLLEKEQNQLVQSGALDAATELKAFRQQLIDELSHLKEGKQGLPGNPEEAGKTESMNLLAEDLRDRWREDRGAWTFKKESLIGEGDSRIDCFGPFSPPFELRFDYEVEEGQRPRVYFGPYTLCHDGYDFALTLFPRPKADKKVHAYERGRRLRIKIHVDEEFVELHVNDRLLERREGGIPEPLPSIGFSGGDNWSPGRTRFFDIELTPGATD